MIEKREQYGRNGRIDEAWVKEGRRIVRWVEARWREVRARGLLALECDGSVRARPGRRGQQIDLARPAESLRYQVRVKSSIQMTRDNDREAIEIEMDRERERERCVPCA